MGNKTPSKVGAKVMLVQHEPPTSLASIRIRLLDSFIQFRRVVFDSGIQQMFDIINNILILITLIEINSHNSS